MKTAAIDDENALRKNMEEALTNQQTSFESTIKSKQI